MLSLGSQICNVIPEYLRSSGQMLNKQKITLTIPTADGDLLHYSAVASEALESASKAPAAEVAASS